jgi:hypothetical protein
MKSEDCLYKKARKSCIIEITLLYENFSDLMQYVSIENRQKKENIDIWKKTLFVNKNVLNEFDELVKENILSPVIL